MSELGKIKIYEPAKGVICAKCKKDDELYADMHGTFCRRCGPSVPVRPTRTVLEFEGERIELREVSDD